MDLFKNTEKINEYKARAKELVAQMTLEEKVSQMIHGAAGIERLGVKSYNWWSEALHGVARAGEATMFPQAIGMAATFDEELMEKVGDAVSTEARAKFNMQQEFEDTDIYKGLTMWAPNVNIFRDPRWGRGHETYGEDPYLTSRLGVGFVKGMQGHNKDFLKVAACAKHFAVHSGPEDIRHSFDAVVNQQDLYETYLPAFKALVEEAGVETVMGAYNRTNGEPCNGSKELLTDILRGKWGFDGHVVSDCWAIKDFHEGHCVTKTPVESVAKAVKAGCDLNCGSLFLYLLQAVEEGLITEEEITTACERLFTSRMKLGLFEDKIPYSDVDYAIVDSKEMADLNLEVAKKCLVLLKNQDDILPLDKSKIKTIGVIGPNANNRKALQGNYEGTASRYVTVLEGIQDYVGDDVRVLASEGCHLFKDRVSALGIPNDRIAEVKKICQMSDVLVAVMGLDAGLEGEEGDEGNEFASGDKPNLNLPGLQEDILKAMVESGKPVILLLLSGSALAVNYADENAAAVMQCWYPGALGGKAVAEVLFGDNTPEGKLPITFYKTSEELPEFTDYNMAGRTYRYMTNEALYPFGYGLSYNTYDITVTGEGLTLDKENGVDIPVTVTNKGSYDSSVTLQAYVKAEREGTPNASLKAISKLAVKAGETVSGTIHLDFDSFALADEKGEFQVLGGDYTVYVGESAPDARSTKLMCKAPTKIAFTI